MKETNEMVKVNELIEVCKDAASGFRLASLEVENKSDRELFSTKALERGDFVRNLQNAALKLGVVPTREGTLLGTMHRAWMNVRHLLNPHEDLIPLLECRRGEEHALKVYEDVLENHLLPQMQPDLEEQFVAMIETRDLLRSRVAKASEGSATGSMLNLF